MKKLMNSESGFTLVELMVVVAIIGVLSAIAVPNFKKYQAKSKTSEAKLQLSALYTAEQSFFADYDSYGTCLQFMGYNPTNEAAQRYYAIGFNTAMTHTVAIANGASGCAAVADKFAAGKALGSVAAADTAYIDTAAWTATENNFLAAAAGKIDKNFVDAPAGTNKCSTFTINENKQILQVNAGY
ncbi:MAG: prepilin-type N-terminal cleavage/methylation domain-containing protein [Bacteriovoracaceae bacterium]|nr:prepilin-type N-terminal cleavage/methylation domain-containing protein [Bacteriovoracaceae bacterium]